MENRTIEHKRITLSNFLKLSDYETFSMYLIAINHSDYYNLVENCLQINDLMDYNYGLIKDFQQELTDDSINSLNSQIDWLRKFVDINDDTIYLDEVTRTIKYLYVAMDDLMNNETLLLSSNVNDISQEEAQAGLERFDRLGIYMQTRKLANYNILDIERVRNMKYSDCFIELYTQKQLDDYEQELNQIRNNKITNN